MVNKKEFEYVMREFAPGLWDSLVNDPDQEIIDMGEDEE